jgi:hypothetical protein
MITNAWSLLIALEGGTDSVRVLTDFVRRLLAAAARTHPL